MLPASFGKENGPIECLQIIILALTAVSALLAAHYGVCSLTTRTLFLWSVPIWLLAIGRELSWGRVLYANPADFIGQTTSWHIVHSSVIAFIIFITIWGLLKYGLRTELLDWVNYGTIPILEILILLGTAILDTIIEHYSFGILGSHEELYEELTELVCYSAALFLNIDFGFVKKIQPVKQLPAKSSS